MQHFREARSEANLIRKQESELRIQLADLKRDHTRLQKELARKKKQATHNKRTHLARKVGKEKPSMIH